MSAALLYYFLRGEDAAELVRVTKEADILPAVLGIVVPLIFFWLTDAAFTVKSFEWFHRPLPLKDYVVVKAASYLLAMINISLGAGGVFIYFIRKTGIKARKQVGLFGFRLSVSASGFVALFTLYALLMLVFGEEHTEKMRWDIALPVIAAVFLILLEWCLFWIWGRGVVLKRLRWRENATLWRAFRESRLRHWAAGWLYTQPPIILNFLGLYVVARSFGIDAPFLYFIFWIPALTMFAALPVAFGGFGTTTAAWVAFFAPYGDPSAIAAATIFIPLVKLLSRSILGLVFLPAATRELTEVTIYHRNRPLFPE